MNDVINEFLDSLAQQKQILLTFHCAFAEPFLVYAPAAGDCPRCGTRKNAEISHTYRSIKYIINNSFLYIHNIDSELSSFASLT